MDTASPDPVVLVDGLEPAALRARLAELDRQARAIKVLLHRRRTGAPRAPAGCPSPKGGRAGAA